MQSPHGAGPTPSHELIDALLASYQAHARTQHIDAIFLPSRARTIEVLALLRRLCFPGFYDDCRLTTDRLRLHVGAMLTRTSDALYEQIRQALRYTMNRDAEGRGDTCDDCDAIAEAHTRALLEQLPMIRAVLADDVQAAFEGDPAAVSPEEAIFCYPGVDAIFIHRIAHALHELGVPLLPRIMSEYAHNETGIDIHPGATIGRSIFIDHGTGVVVGETTLIGDRVKIYQGVTLGALSTKGGQAWRGRKRHPTIEDDVTIYPNATILGGETVIGAGSTVGGGVFITESIPPNHKVTNEPTELRVKPHRAAAPA